MNKARRKVLLNATGKLEELKEKSSVQEALSGLKDALHDVTVCAFEENNCLDSLPESLEFSSRYKNMEQNFSDLSKAMNEIKKAIVNLDGESDYDYKLIKAEVENAIEYMENPIDR